MKRLATILSQSKLAIDDIRLIIPADPRAMKTWHSYIEVNGISKKRTFDDCAPHGHGEFYCAANKKGDKIVLDGNPQTNESGQNVQPSVAHRAVLEAFVRNALVVALPGKTSAVTETAIKTRDLKVTRIAIAFDFLLDSPDDGPEIIDAFNYVFRYLAPRKTGNLWHDGPVNESTYYRPRSKYWGLKVYLKGPQVRATWSQRHETLPCYRKLRRLADRVVRIELVLRYRELKRLRLVNWGDWKPDTPNELMLKYLGKLNLETSFVKGPPAADVSGLAGLEYLAYLAYLNGYDLRKHLSLGSYRRYVRSFMARNIDIRVPRPRGRRPKVNLLDQIHRGARRGVRTWAKRAGLFRHWSDPKYLQRLRDAGVRQAVKFERLKHG